MKFRSVSSILTVAIFFLFSLVVLGQSEDTRTAREHFAKGLTLMREGAFEQALSSFQTSAVLDSKQPATFANIGAIELILKHYEKAEAAIRMAIRLDPNNGLFHSDLCSALSIQKKHTAAIEACDEGVRINPESDRAHAARFTAMQAAGRNLADLQRSIDLAVGRFRNSELLLVLASDFYIINLNFSYAATLLESLTAMKSGIAKYHGVLAEVYLRLGRDNDALSSARTSLRLDPQNPYANYSMGLIFYELGQNEEAAESFAKVHSDDPRLNYAGYFRAVSESRLGKTTVAVDILRILCEQHPDNVEFQYQLARDLSTLHRYDEAETAYLKANVLTPKNADILSGLGMTHMMRAQFEKAIVYFEEAFRLKPDNEFYKMFLNVSRGRQNLIPQIPTMIRDAEARPKDIKIRVDLARTLAFANRIGEAEKYVNELYALNPEDSGIYQILGVSFSEAGLPDKSLTAYRKSLEKKENPAAYLGIAGILANRGEADAASAAYSKVIELKPDTPNIMKAYGDHLRNNGKRREALAMYKRSLALLPTNAPAIFAAGMLSMKLGDRESALLYLGSLNSIDRKLAKTLERCLALRIWG